MKKVLCRVVSFILMMTMIMSMAISVGASKPEDFNDFPSESYWATPALKAALANNILYGKENGNIDSKANLTRAEMAAIISRAFGAVVKSDISGFKDLDPAQWYYSEFAKAVRMGVFSGDENGNMNPDSPITREEAFTVFARAMVLSDDDTSVLSKFGDASDISGWAEKYLAPLVKKGYVNGNEANNLLPKNNITREEFAQFMHNMFKTYYSNQGTYKEVGTDSAIINTTDVNLTGITVEDDLVIGDGADLSTITLTNVVIKGRLLVRGAATVRLVNVTVAEGVVVNNVNATVHFDNYASELVFTGINMNTPATFKENYSISSGGSNTGGGTSTPTYPYYVRYYEQNIAQDDYVLVRTDTFSGKSGTNVSVSVPRKTGFTYNAANSTTSGSVVGSPYLVLEVYYDRNTYTVSFDADGGMPAPADQLIPYKGTIALPTVTKAGYAFDGWYNGTERIESTTQVTSAMSLTAHWTLLPPTDAQYTVYYYQQKVDLTGYEEVIADRVVTTGTIGENVTAPSKTYTGFTQNTTLGTTSGTVRADGSLELKVYFDRNIYTVSFDADGGTPAPADQFIPYQGTIALPTVTKAGYAFDGWYNGTERIESTTQVTSAMSLTAHWTLLPPTTAQYTVYYYQQKVDLTGYEEVIADRVVTTGTIGEVVTAPSKTYTGFTQNTTLSTTSGTVRADGSLELKVYFDRNTYTVTFKEGTSVLGEEIVAANTTLDASRIPSTTRKYTGFTKDGSISSVYVSSPKTYEIAFNWWYNPEIGKWEQFTDETVVKGNMTVYSTSQRVNLNLYVDKLGRSLTFGTYYAPDTRLADAINDVLSQGASLRAVKDTGFYDKALEKLNEYNLIDDSGNILMQEILVKFSKIIGETNLEEYIVDSAKEMFTTSDRLRNSIIDYIRLKASSSNPNDVTEIKEFIERIIAYSINNTATGMTDAETMFRSMMESDDTFFKDVTGYEPSSLIPAQKELIIDQTIAEFETNTFVQAQAISKVASYIIKPAHISRIDGYVDHALAYLNSDTTLRDQVVDDIIEKMYRDTLDTLLYEVINERQFEVNIDNVFVAEGLKNKVEEFNFDEIKNQIPDKFFAVYPESKLREIFEDASSRILAQINAALADADLGISSYVDTGYTFIINPVSDIYTPLYERALEIIRDKNVYYNENIYLKELLTLFETNSIFDGSENAKPNALSGYSLKTIDDYYDIVKKSAILGDDALVWYNENLNVDRINEVIDNYESIVLKYVNLAADILDNYANTGEIPDRLDNKFVNAFENAVKQKFPSLVNRLVDWYKTSPINKDYTGDDYAKIKKGINFAFNNVNITVNEVFDDILAIKFSEYKTANDTYSKEFKGNKVTFYREIQR